MKNTLKLLFVPILFMIIYTSCTPSLSEVWVNKDGSGKMTTEMDIGEMAGMMQAMMAEEGETPKERPDEKMDSTMVFGEIIPDSLKEGLSNVHLLDQVQLRMSIDSEIDKALISFQMEYKSEDELNDMMALFAEIDAKKNDVNPALAMQEEGIGGMFNAIQVDYDRGIFKMKGTDMEEMRNDPEFEEMLLTLDSIEMKKEQLAAGEELDGESKMALEMLEMMFGGETMVKIHLPDDVQFTNRVDAQIDGNTVIYNDVMMDVLRKGSKDLVVKYKGKKE